MNITRKTRVTLASSTAIAIAIALFPASAASAETDTPIPPAETSTSPVQISLEEFEHELALLAKLSDDELTAAITASVAAYDTAAAGTAPTDEPPTVTKRALPLVPVIVWGIGCGFAGLSSVATNSWKNADSAAWAIGGILVGCIPGFGQAAIVEVILANKKTIANALKTVGLTAPALALTGSSKR